MISKYVESASSFAGQIDFVILLITAIVGFWWLLAETVFFYFIIKFNAKDGVKAQYIAGEHPKEKKWVSIPHYATLIFDVTIMFFAVQAWQEVKQTMPQADATVRIIAQQWAWTFVHPGPDGKLDTADDLRLVDELHVEKDKTYQFELQSRDVLHSFSVPVFRLKQDIIPGRTIRGWFKPTMAGGFDIQCTEICGIGHGLMPGRIIVHSAEDFAAWQLSQTPATAALTTPTEQTGGMK